MGSTQYETLRDAPVFEMSKLLPKVVDPDAGT